MPAPVDQSTLEFISGRMQLQDTANLLDNTLATMSHKMKQREQQEMSKLRNLQIQQGNLELAEIQKGIYARDLQRQLLERQTASELDNFEENQAMTQDMKRFQYMEGQSQATDITLNRIFQSTDNESAQSMLDQYGDVLPEGTYNVLRNTDFSNPASKRKAEQQVIKDLEFMRQLELVKAKEQAAASAAGPAKITDVGFNQDAFVKSLKDNYGISGSEATTVSVVTSDILKRYKDAGVRADANVVGDTAARLLAGNKDKYVTDNPFWGTGSTTDMPALMRDTINAMEGIAPSGTGESEPYRAYGYSKESWDAFVKSNPAYTEEELLNSLGR